MAESEIYSFAIGSSDQENVCKSQAPTLHYSLGTVTSPSVQATGTDSRLHGNRLPWAFHFARRLERPCFCNGAFPNTGNTLQQEATSAITRPSDSSV
jgi:hypothetical protein